MSSHAQLKQDLSHVTEYAGHLARIFRQARNDFPYWTHPLLAKQKGNSQLFIIVGSQKGLCGSFTNIIAHKAIAAYNSIGNQAIITVGKQINTLLSNNYGIIPILSFNQFNSDGYATIARSIVDYIWDNEQRFDQITVISMKSKGFFVQTPMKHELIQSNFFTKGVQELEYCYEKNAQESIASLFKQTLVATLMGYLHDSLIAEQAARFLSMDNSTRNAKKILEATKLYYNKLRQTKITTQLMELVTVVGRN